MQISAIGILACAVTMTAAAVGFSSTTDKTLAYISLLLFGAGCFMLATHLHVNCGP